MAPRWIERKVLDAIQEDQRQQHGGNSGILNAGNIDSALGRPRNRFAYKGAGLFACAASYVFGIPKNHGYEDANKRTAYMAALTFLRISGYRVQATPQDIITLMLDVANDLVDEPAIEAWFEARATVIA